MYPKFMNKELPPHITLESLMRADLEGSRKACDVLNKLHGLENQVSESNVHFPFTAMFEFARVMYEINNMTPYSGWNDYNVFSVQFSDFSITNNVPKGMFSVSMFCQYKRFEEFVDRYGATITRVSVYNNENLHVYAVVKDDTLGWFEIKSIYDRANLQLVENSVFEDVDSIQDLFMIYATVKDWKVSERAWEDPYDT